MNTETHPPQDAATKSLPPRKGRRYIPHLGSWIVGGFILLMLAAVILPATNSTCIKSPLTKSLAQAKQVGLALKVFASDHDGNYPRAGLPEMLGADVKDSNAAFAVLFPQYLTNEAIFANKLSAYQTRTPDNVIDNPYTGKPVKTLEPGENVYAYVAGLHEESESGLPLVLDGTDGTGHYTTDAKKRGGLWEGKRAVVIRLDNSGAVENLVGPDHARYIHSPQGEGVNLLDPTILGSGVRLLDPAVGSR